MERILIGLPDFTIKKIVSVQPAVIEVEYTGQPACPHCQSRALRLKDSFWRFIRNVPFRGR
ncbi:hypothetical protein SAMN02745704_01248, partial [Paucidesulfovibrio gracilis DSM 16080]